MIRVILSLQDMFKTCLITRRSSHDWFVHSLKVGSNRAETAVDRLQQGWMGSSVEFVLFEIGFGPDFVKFDRIFNRTLDKLVKMGFKSDPKLTKLD